MIKIICLGMILGFSGCVSTKLYESDMYIMRQNQAAQVNFSQEFAKGFEIQAKSISLLSEITQLLSDKVASLEKRVGDLESKKVKK